MTDRETQMLSALKEISAFSTADEFEPDDSDPDFEDGGGWDGLDREEWLEMAYDNVIWIARAALAKARGEDQ